MYISNIREYMFHVLKISVLSCFKAPNSSCVTAMVLVLNSALTQRWGSTVKAPLSTVIVLFLQSAFRKEAHFLTVPSPVHACCLAVLMGKSLGQFKSSADLHVRQLLSRYSLETCCHSPYSVALISRMLILTPCAVRLPFAHNVAICKAPCFTYKTLKPLFSVAQGF